MNDNIEYTIGQYLAKRLQMLGIEDYFVVPGDYNLLLLDQILENKALNMISCSNELDAGYAADGYARAAGAAAMFVTYSVGGLSAINAIAGAYAENLPVIIISGAPNTNAIHNNQLLHHTLGKIDFHYVADMYQHVTAAVEVIRDVHEAPYKIDSAIRTALRERKPVYIEIPCNLPKQIVSSQPSSSLTASVPLNKATMEMAIEHAASLLNNAKQPVLVTGPQIRAWQVEDSFTQLAHSSGYAVASMPDAKGIFSETDPQFIGTYWGPVSSEGCQAVVENADAYLFAGPIFTDYTTTGYLMPIEAKKLVLVEKDQVHVAGQLYLDLNPEQFMQALAAKLTANDASLKIYKKPPAKTLSKTYQIQDPLTTEYTFHKIQNMLNPQSAILAETGDSWFNCIDLDLPNTCPFAIQMTYGSIGWSVGATLGYQLALQGKRRVIASIGDGSFQLSAQAVSTMLRYNIKPIIFIMNNGAYTIEVEIHDGPYNVLNNWRYANLVDTFNTTGSDAWGCAVKTVAELDAAVEKALATDALCLIEVHLDRNDCNPKLIEWGKHVAKANGAAYQAPTGYKEL